MDDRGPSDQIGFFPESQYQVPRYASQTQSLVKRLSILWRIFGIRTRILGSENLNVVHETTVFQLVYDFRRLEVWFACSLFPELFRLAERDGCLNVVFPV